MGLKPLTGLVATVAIGAEAGWPLLAQAVEASGLAEFPFGNITAIGVLCWYAYHTTAKTIPGLISSYQDEQQKERTMFVAMINTERDHHAMQIDKLGERLKAVEDTITRETHLLAKAVHELAVAHTKEREQ